MLASVSLRPSGLLQHALTLFALIVRRTPQMPARKAAKPQKSARAPQEAPKAGQRPRRSPSAPRKGAEAGGGGGGALAAVGAAFVVAAVLMAVTLGGADDPGKAESRRRDGLERELERQIGEAPWSKGTNIAVRQPASRIRNSPLLEALQ